jgi:hypothetical protein
MRNSAANTSTIIKVTFVFFVDYLGYEPLPAAWGNSAEEISSFTSQFAQTILPLKKVASGDASHTVKSAGSDAVTHVK